MNVEAKEYLFPHKELWSIDLDDVREELTTLKKNKGHYVQDNESSPLGWMLTFRTEEKTEYWNTLVRLQAVVKTIFEKIADKPFDIRTEIEESYKPFDPENERKGCKNGISTLIIDKVIFCFDEYSGKYVFTWLPFTTHERYIELKIYRMLDGLPRYVIRKCEGCDKYFLYKPQRKKNFCSPRCMWRKNAEKRRKADPEGYRAKQREIMRKKYLKDSAEKRGTTPDKIKLQKSGRKKGE